VRCLVLLFLSYITVYTPRISSLVLLDFRKSVHFINTSSFLDYHAIIDHKSWYRIEHISRRQIREISNYCRIRFEHKVKGYQKLTLITAILGLFILVPIIVGYAYVNSLIGFPVLGLFLGGLLLHVFLLIIVNVVSLYCL